MEPLEMADATEEVPMRIKALCISIDREINEVGRLADFCSGDNGNETAGVHGLQMCYDRLYEAKAWASQALKELE